MLRFFHDKNFIDDKFFFWLLIQVHLFNSHRYVFLSVGYEHTTRSTRTEKLRLFSSHCSQYLAYPWPILTMLWYISFGSLFIQISFNWLTTSVDWEGCFACLRFTTGVSSSGILVLISLVLLLFSIMDDRGDAFVN